MNCFNRSIGLASAAVLAGALFAASVEAKTLKVNEDLGPGSVEDKGLRKFKEVVEDKTKGEITIRVHLLAELGKQQTSIENLMTGTLELYSGDLSLYATLVPDELGVITVPYLFKDNDHLRRYLKSATFERAHKKLIEKGIRFISTDFTSDRGPYRIWVSSKPVLRLEDLQGVKMRLWPNDMAIRAWRHLGAVPSVIAWQETYLAIRQGVVSAVTSGVNAINDMKFTEVAPYITEIREFPQIWPIAVSEKIWQGLTPDQQKIFVDAANQAMKLYGDETYASANKAIDRMIRENNAVYIRPNLDPFVKKMEALYQDMIKEGVLKKEVYDEVMRLR